ncbi:hypothetical protein C4561_01850 [candidate division WWE3 bacterium]|uniref:Calcineurin-like phosphoesterase domain-containing protein n=1 Tax=candidate division WWE3 bacterium TaxID=2053526 RepID=A0A3A4ZEU1_UNCKA|nr:MAG: hypothetical protein C4561_01850 [candidate division WWE3 bacterium]
MAGRRWTQEEIDFVKSSLGKGHHPREISLLLEQRFGVGRTIAAIKLLLTNSGISWNHLAGRRSITDENVGERVKNDVALERIQAELRILKRRYSEAVQTVSEHLDIISQMKDYLQAFPEPDLKFRDIVSKKSTTKETLLMLISDIHFGEVVRKREILGLNSYDMDIAAQRLKWYVTRVVDIAKNKLRGYTFDKVVVASLGDVVSGNIHDELREEVEGNIVEWTVGAAHLMGQALTELSKYFKEVEFVGVVGNHGRVFQKPRYKSRYVNWDYMTYQLLEGLLEKNKRIKFILPKSFWHVHNINGHNFLLLHGDNIKSYYGIPFYGIQRTVTQLTELLFAEDVRMDYVLLGHFHTSNTLSRMKGKVFLNGSMKGADEFSLGRLFTGTRASQLLIGVHPERTSFEFAIDLQDAEISTIEGYSFRSEKSEDEIKKTVHAVLKEGHDKNRK